VRADDIGVSYARIIPLPQKYRLMLRSSFIIPTSFASKKMGLITAGRLTVQVDKTFGKYVYMNLRTFGDGYLQQYTSMEGGATPNPIARLGGTFEVTVSMPFHPRLSVGSFLFTGYNWSYDANARPPPLTGYPEGGQTVSADRQFTHQPTKQSYGGEIYARYQLPSIGGFNSNMEVGFASGDGTTGYTSRTHDGVSHLYLVWRNTAQVYGALSATF